MHALETARQRVRPRVWVLPWTFASEVLGGTPVCELDERYNRFWMPTTQTLRHVFILVREFDDAWYLVIVDIKDRVVYALDVCRSPDSMKRRKETIDSLGVAGDMNRDQTGLWMLYWLQHEPGNPNHVRMRTAVNIVKSESNEIHDLIEAKANHAWQEMLGVHNH
ncbi:hypothetical protein PIB30_047908 [Stylosanthes scabra]|uniref:Ubiquitin-like protease family profile domain-containing protein n=1 Tax=Stylosanthes scabra TaxID=79078 RepID=A0ABU6SGZ2_9FABA|nr:hypothetical protein [Stylosanthes scabra]